MFMDCLQVLETGDFSNLLINLYDNVDADTTDFHEIMIEAIENIPNYQPLIDLDYPMSLSIFKIILVHIPTIAN